VLAQVNDVREERRQVTVLFSDVSGYTTMAEELDPELLRELMSTVYGRAGEIVDRYGGRIDKLMGDAVLAVFGDPIAHEDDAVRAVRAAMELHAAVAELGPAVDAHTGQGIEMHSGINSGIVVSSDHVRDRESGPLGDMVNVAARLQSAATAGQIVVGAETIALLGDAFALRELGELELKGRRGSVRAAVVEGVSSAGPGPSRRASAFVGRHEELGVLLDGVDKVRDGQSVVVTVCADAGAGKSRLLEEFRSRLDADVVWVEGKAFAYTTNIPYAPIIDLMSKVAGIDEGDSAAAVSEKLEHLVERVAPGDEAAARVIRQLYGVSDQNGIDLEAFRSELAGALSRLIEETAKRSPTVVCFQDLHWVDPSTTALIRELLSRGGSPRLTVCNFRPGFELDVPGVRHLELTDLSARQTREQLASLLEGGDPPAPLVDLVVDRADGNPFFAEEIVNSLIDRDVLVNRDGVWAIRDGDIEASVPSTIRALLEARIDDLDGPRKRVLREASVVGRAFLHRVMESVASEPDDLPRDLEQLSAADLIRPVPFSDAELEYIFKHALTQEVAYEGLLLRDRQVLHAKVARSIEAQFPDRVAEMVETLAYHYQRSGLVEPAVKYLRLAGAKALAQYSMEEAHHHYRSAHELLAAADGSSGLDPATRDLLMLGTALDWSHAFYYTGEYQALLALQAEHVGLAERVGDPALEARWLAWVGMAEWTGKAAISRPIELLEAAYARADACGDPTGKGYAAAWLIWALWMNGQTERSIAMLGEVETFVDQIPDPYDRRYVTLKSLGGAGTAAASAGRLSEAVGLAKELQAISDSTGNRRAGSLAHCVSAAVHFVLGDGPEFSRQAQLAIDIEADPIYAQLANSWYVGGKVALGDVAEAAERHEVVGHLPRESGNALMGAQADVYDASIAILQGRLRHASKRLDAIRRERQEAGDAWLMGTIDAVFASMAARIATKEADGSALAALANPGFVKRHVIGAAKKGRTRLLAYDRAAEENGYHGLRASTAFELGKLAMATGRPDEAREYFRRMVQILADFPESTYHREATARLAELGPP
jgi:class 3 adenylate cyclase/tetratricopeptide (TPR) repeat protein